MAFIIFKEQTLNILSPSQEIKLVVKVLEEKTSIHKYPGSLSVFLDPLKPNCYSYESKISNVVRNISIQRRLEKNQKLLL